jgi:hypothetical protein
MKSRLKINNKIPMHTAELNLEECINELLTFLKLVQQIWLNYVNELRNQFENLNYFTNKQLKLIMNNLRVDQNYQLIIDDFQLVNSIIFNLNSSLTHEKMKEAFSLNLKEITSQKEELEKFSNLNAYWTEFVNGQNKNRFTLKQLAILFDKIAKPQVIPQNINGFIKGI